MNYTTNHYPELRDHFLNVFMKGTYKKRSYHESPSSRGHFIRTQPRVRGRFLAEGAYNGKYKPGTFHKALDEHRFDFMVIGRYYTENFSYKHYRIKVIILSGSLKGRIGFISVG